MSMRLAQMALNNAKAKYGKGWDLLGAVFRENAVVKEIVMIILSQGESTEGFQGAIELIRATYSLLVDE